MYKIYKDEIDFDNRIFFYYFNPINTQFSIKILLEINPNYVDKFTDQYKRLLKIVLRTDYYVNLFNILTDIYRKYKYKNNDIVLIKKRIIISYIYLSFLSLRLSLIDDLLEIISDSLPLNQHKLIFKAKNTRIKLNKKIILVDKYMKSI